MRIQTLIVTASALSLCAAAAIAEPLESPPLLDTITLWLAANFNLPASSEVPQLAGTTDALLVELRYGPEADVAPGEVVAVYDDLSRTIFVSEGWTGRTPSELSVLVHEMVHHLQSTANVRFACPAEQEALAFRAQDAWLSLFGESLESAFGIDPATLLVATVCTH